MPAFDSSGPRGRGPLTGCGQGPCRYPGYQPVAVRGNPARGLGRGLGPGGGRGRGQRFLTAGSGSWPNFTLGPPK